MFQRFLASFPDSSPSIKRLAVRVRHPEDTLMKLESDFLSRWGNIQSVVCPQLALGVDALGHLSRMPVLTRLTFKQVTTLPAPDTSLSFHNLRYLTVYSKSLAPISRLFSQMQAPTITEVAVIVDSCPSRPELSSFLAALETSNAGHAIESLTLDQPFPMMTTERGPEPVVLNFEDLRPCVAFHHLRRLKLNITWNVSLRDNDVLTLASAWPHLEHFVINSYSGWNASGGVTPHGLLVLLQRCCELQWIALALDTRGYAASPVNDSLLPATSTPRLAHPLQRTLFINVLDSAIEAEAVPSVAAFFATIVPCANVSFRAWRGGKMVRPEGWEVYNMRWENVFRWAHRQSAFLSHYMVGD